MELTQPRWVFTFQNSWLKGRRIWGRKSLYRNKIRWDFTKSPHIQNQIHFYHELMPLAVFPSPSPMSRKIERKSHLTRFSTFSQISAFLNPKSFTRLKLLFLATILVQFLIIWVLILFFHNRQTKLLTYSGIICTNYNETHRQERQEEPGDRAAGRVLVWHATNLRLILSSPCMEVPWAGQE